MTKANDIELKVYDQLQEVSKCVNALKDVSQNIPEDDRYASVLSIIHEKLDAEFEKLQVISLSALRGDPNGNLELVN